MKKEPTIAGLTDRTPRYTVKEIAEKMNLTTYAVRYYDNAGLIPYVERTSGNIRLFSDYNLAWLKIVHCLRSTGLPVTEQYIYSFYLEQAIRLGGIVHSESSEAD